MTRLKFILTLTAMICSTALVIMLAIKSASEEQYYLIYNTYVQNIRGEMVEQAEDKHITLRATSLDDANKIIFEIENQLYEDVVVDSVAIQSHVIVKEY